MAKIGQYETLFKLGVGGMAEVLLGRSTGVGGFEKLVAVKRILPHMTEDEKFVKMFIDEATISARLNHSSIGQIFEFGRSDDSYYIAMEFIQGVDLRSIHKVFRNRDMAPTPELGAFIIMNVCAALHYAHTMTDARGQPLGIIHRDLSPSNVLVSYEGQVKLIDFGIAKAAQRLYVTVGPNLKGKFAYMSPEQASGTAMDHRSDIFGAGILLFELLTGRNPFRATRDIDTLQRVLAARVPNPCRVVPDVPQELDRICMKALALNPDHRYAYASQMQEELETYSRRTGFGARRMGRWMKEAFREDIEKWQQVIRAARQEASTFRATEDDGGRVLVHGDSGGQEQVFELIPKRTDADSLPGTGTGPAPPPPVGGEAGSWPEAPLEAAAGSWPGTHPGGPQGPWAPQAGGWEGGAPLLLESGRQAPARHRGRLLPHALAVLLLAVGLGAAGYLWVGRERAPVPERPPPAPTGAVQVRLEPPTRARVFVDGAPRGEILPGEALLLRGLSAGAHRLRVEAPTLRPQQETVEVLQDQTVELSLQAEPLAPPGEAGAAVN